VLTPAFDLPNRCVIHCLGPVYGVDRPEAELLASCYRNALCLAEEHGLSSIAFVAISTGVFGYPMAEAAEVALRTVIAAAPRLHRVHLVRFCLADDRALATFERIAATLLPSPAGDS
jgi:O-acetyl-ADP-ribose deacetylase (regulator of RNase III)